MQKFQFAELNIKHRGNPGQTLNIVRRAIRMGYDTVVINTDVGNFGAADLFTENQSEEQPTKKKRKKQQKQQEAEPVKEIVPPPFRVDESQLDLSTFQTSGKRFRQFSRLTVTIDANSVHKLQHNPTAKLYDIVAVRVPDEQLLMTLQRKGDFVDLITLDGASPEVGRIPWLYKQKIVQSCVAVGIYFELCYAHALQSSERRRQFFAQARKLMEITRGGRGVVLSSGADEMIALRGPFDVSNLCTLFGLPPRNGRKFVSENARDALLRSQTRKTIKGAIHVADLSNDPNPMIPSASGLPVEQTLQQLAQIEEFRAELGDVKRGEKRRNEEEQMEVDQQRRVKKRQRNGGEEEEDLHNFETTSSCAAASSSTKEIDKLLEIIL